jgi:hypothetical protein
VFASFNVTSHENESTQSRNEKEAVGDVFKNYMKKYNHFIKNQQLKRTPELYTPQVMLISGSGKSSTLTSEAMNKGVTGFLTKLKAKGVDKVAWEIVDIKFLAKNIAIASNVAVRYLADGEVYDRAGATYFLNKAEQGWRISAFALHAPENAINFLSKG